MKYTNLLFSDKTFRDQHAAVGADQMALAGPSGSGKTTLLNMIGCIDTPSSGRVIVDGHDVTGRDPDQLAELRARTLGFIFQTFNLLPVLSAEENVEYPLINIQHIPRAERRQRVAYFLDMVGLARFARHRPNQLSGGQRQRVGLARALFGMPPLVVLDEPNASLDARGDAALLGTIKKLKAMNVTTIIVSHRSNLLELADKILLMIDGQAAKFGDARTVVEEMAGKRRVIQPGGAPGGPKAPPAMAPGMAIASIRFTPPVNFGRPARKLTPSLRTPHHSNVH